MLYISPFSRSESDSWIFHGYTISEWDFGKVLLRWLSASAFFFWVTWLSGALFISYASLLIPILTSCHTGQILTHAKSPPSIISMTIPRSRVELTNNKQNSIFMPYSNYWIAALVNLGVKLHSKALEHCSSGIYGLFAMLPNWVQ